MVSFSQPSLLCLLGLQEIGFLGKVKKLLETVCHNCGKIKAVDVSLGHYIRLDVARN
jgi:hypothetical protein